MPLFIPQNLKRWTLPSDYAGANWPEYYRAPVGQHRDSDALTRSNWRVQWKALEPLKAEHAGPNPDGSADAPESPRIVRENHWAVGWVERVAIHQSNEAALRAADELAGRLEDYPILDEMDWSDEENEEAEQVWSNCLSPKERLAFIREHRREFEFRGLADLLGSIRGRYFGGYASSLLH